MSAGGLVPLIDDLLDVGFPHHERGVQGVVQAGPIKAENQQWEGPSGSSSGFSPGPEPVRHRENC